MKKLFLALISSLVMAGSVPADIVDRGEIKVRFQVVNLDDFPDLQIYYMFQGYHYDRGYQPDEPKRTDVTSGEKKYQASSRYGKTVLQACDSLGNCYVGVLKLGGRDHTRVYDIAYKVQKVKIKGVKDGVLVYKVVGEYFVDHQGKTVSSRGRSREDDAYPGLFGDRPWMFYLLIPAIAMFSLLLMMALRRRQLHATLNA